MKDVWEWKVHSRRLPICYSSNSIKHPAKMHLQMCRDIIKLYSKKGDLVLDVMAGIGTTVIEGMLLGRNVVGVEYEEKFVLMAQENIVKTRKNFSYLKGLGHGRVIKGDSRDLSSVLEKVDIDSIIFSPSFESVTMEKPPSDKWKGPDFSNQVYSEDKSYMNQIGNLKHGVIDSIITSPPYEDGTQRQRLPNTDESKGGQTNYPDGYSDDSDNVRNQKGKNYLTEMLKIYCQCLKVLRNNGWMVLVLKNFVRKGETVRLDLDTIKLVEKAGFTYVRRHYRKISNPSFWITNAIIKWEKKHPGVKHPYPLEEDILVFQKQVKGGGRVDSVIFSPPFGDIEPFHDKNWVYKGKNIGAHYDVYSSNPENIGNLKYKGDKK